MKNSNVTSRKRINFSITLGLIFGLVSISTSYAADISVSVSPTNPFRDFPVASSGGSYQVDVNANGGDSVVQLYSGVSAGTFNSAFAPNPANHVNENDDYMGLSSRITGTVISGPHVIRVTSYRYWTGQTSPTQTYTLSYTGFTSATEPPTQYEPILSPYLMSTTAPQIHIKDEELVCTAGNYQAGIADRGDIPTHGKDAYKPSNFTYNLLINGQSQRSLVINSSESSVSWNRSKISSEAVVFCSVAVTWNSLTVEASSTGNTDGMEQAESRQREDVVKADKVYFEVLYGNLEKYKKVLVDNRATWRKQIDAIRTNYYDTLNRIKANGGSKMVTDTSTALKIMIAAQKKSAADYAASKPAALVAKDAANKAALISRDAAIAKANATYGTFIESIGYGVLIP